MSLLRRILLVATVVVLAVASAAVPAQAELEAACPKNEVPVAPFADTSGNVHEFAVACVVWWGITSGTTATTYSPGAPVTRGQMATFLDRMLTAIGADLPPATSQGFTDIGRSVHRDAINRLKKAGIVAGKSAARYAPSDPVYRDQMATYLVNAFTFVTGQEPSARRDYFRDDDGNRHETSINIVAEQGFASGVADGLYAPGRVVARDQMATFLVRLIDGLYFLAFTRLPAPVGDVRAGLWWAPSPDGVAAAVVWFFDPTSHPSIGTGQAYDPTGTAQVGDPVTFTWIRAEEVVLMEFANGTVDAFALIGHDTATDTLTLNWQGLALTWYGCESGQMPPAVAADCP